MTDQEINSITMIVSGYVGSITSSAKKAAGTFCSKCHAHEVHDENIGRQQTALVNYIAQLVGDRDIQMFELKDKYQKLLAKTAELKKQLGIELDLPPLPGFVDEAIKEFMKKKD